MTETPRYRAVAEALKARIAEGVYRVGTLLPTEQALCDSFDVSRYTIREALRLLAEDGLVERRQGRGTEVVSLHDRPMFTQSLSSIDQLYNYAADTRLVIDRVLRVVPDNELALQLGRKPGRQWLLVEGIRRTSDGVLICASRVFIHQNFASLAPELPDHQGAIHVLIERRFGVVATEVHQDITTVRPDAIVSGVLGEPPGGWSVLVTRRYLAADDRPILVSMNWHRLQGFAHGQILRRD